MSHVFGVLCDGLWAANVCLWVGVMKVTQDEEVFWGSRAACCFLTYTQIHHQLAAVGPSRKTVHWKRRKLPLTFASLVSISGTHTLGSYVAGSCGPVRSSKQPWRPFVNADTGWSTTSGGNPDDWSTATLQSATWFSEEMPRLLSV